jgi:type II secretory pathway pseudopilin PulG
MRRTKHSPQRGFTYLAVLFALALMSVSALLVTAVSSHLARREREAELLFVGEQYRDALRRYGDANAGLPDPYPRELSGLLRDPNTPNTRRFLRKLYADPLTGSERWGLVRTPRGGIIGVYSLAEGRPAKVAGFAAAQGEFAGAKRYADWRFVVAPGRG